MVDQLNKDLFHAVLSENIEAAKLYIRLGADVNVIDCYGLTPIVWAAYNKNQEMVGVLEKAGAYPAAYVVDVVGMRS